MDARIVGISTYVDGSPRVALHGRIKKQAADFVVQEVSLDGGVVTLDATNENLHRLPTNEERNVVVAEMEGTRQSSRKHRAKEPLVFEDPPAGWTEELKTVVGGSDVVARIESVALSEGNEADEDMVVLDAPSDFRKRVYLQICIQHSFPSLDCKLRTAPAHNDSAKDADCADERHQIEIAQDGLYKKFRQAGISNGNACSLLAFIRKGATHAESNAGIELEHEDSKEARTALHHQICGASSLLRTRTETRHGKQCIVVGFSPHNKKKRKRIDQPPEPYVQFVLQKTNLEHFTCFEYLGRVLKRPPSAFATAGTKDKVATTYQQVTVQGVDPQRLLELNCRQDENESTSGSSSSTGIRVGLIKFVSSPMSLGSLTGNQFTIVVRDLPKDLDECDFQSRIEHVKQHGFVNYFGFQRVGLPTSVVRPHQIGELIIAAKWEEAVQTMLTPSPQDPPECAAAKAAYIADRDNIDAVLKLVPQNSMQAERAVLAGLKRFGSTNWEAAVRNIPFARRVMYLHAYQSYVFNMLASYRMEHYGSTVVEGDLVREEGGNAVVVASEELAQRLNASLPNALSCVVLPLPGSSVLLPNNKLKKYLQQLLDQHETAAELTASNDLKGAYRALIEKPRGIEWSRMDDDRTALTMQFCLSSGCFATMCLREVLHSNS